MGELDYELNPVKKVIHAYYNLRSGSYKNEPLAIRSGHFAGAHQNNIKINISFRPTLKATK